MTDTEKGHMDYPSVPPENINPPKIKKKRGGKRKIVRIDMTKKSAAAKRNDVSSIDLAREVPLRIPDWDKLTEMEKRKAVILCIMQDFYLFCAKNLYIKNKRGQLVRLTPNAAQEALLEAVMEDLVKGRPVRYIVLKARQMGLSTIIEALAYWWAATHPYVSCAIAAHDSDANQNLYQMFRTYYENTDRAFKPQTKYFTQNDLTFDTEKGNGLKSSIKTFVAKRGGVGRSSTNTFLHCSEVAFWEGGTEIVAGLLQTIPLLRDTFIFLESTANGVGGYFYDEWQLSKKGDSVFKPFFFAWHGHAEYELNVPPTMGKYDEDEKELLKLFKKLGYPEKSWKRKIQWRRQKIKEFRSDPDKFKQEYPSTDMEAFIASGRPVFDIKKLIEMEKWHDRNPPKYVELDGNWRKVTHRVVDQSPFKVWEEPQPGEKYVIGVDVAEGIEGGSEGGREGDYSVIDVMKQSNLQTVARWRGHIDPDLLGEEVVLVGWWYNTALVGVESNNHGLTTLQRVRDKFYRNLYMRKRGAEELFEMSTSKMGWRTDRKTKPLMIDDLAKAIRDGDIIDYDITFIRECMTYVRDDRGMTNAQEGQHDDTVIAKAIALQMCVWNIPERQDLSIKKPIQRANYGLHVVRRAKKITLD